MVCASHTLSPAAAFDSQLSPAAAFDSRVSSNGAELHVRPERELEVS